jgi:hypothetical protein
MVLSQSIAVTAPTFENEAGIRLAFHFPYLDRRTGFLYRHHQRQ